MRDRVTLSNMVLWRHSGNEIEFDARRTSWHAQVRGILRRQGVQLDSSLGVINIDDTSHFRAVLYPRLIVHRISEHVLARMHAELPSPLSPERDSPLHGPHGANARRI